MSRSIGSGHGRTLLVVGPEDDTRAALAFLLEREGYEVAQARDQSEAMVRRYDAAQRVSAADAAVTLPNEMLTVSGSLRLELGS